MSKLKNILISGPIILSLLLLFCACSKKYALYFGENGLIRIDTLHAVDYNHVRIRVSFVKQAQEPFNKVKISWYSDAPELKYEEGKIENYLTLPISTFVDTVIQVGLGPLLKIGATPTNGRYEHTTTWKSIYLNTPKILHQAHIPTGDKLSSVIPLKSGEFAVLGYHTDPTGHYRSIRKISADLRPISMVTWKVPCEVTKSYLLAQGEEFDVFEATSDTLNRVHYITMYRLDFNGVPLWSKPISQSKDNLLVLEARQFATGQTIVTYRENSADPKIIEVAVNKQGAILERKTVNLPVEITKDLVDGQILALAPQDYVIALPIHREDSEKQWGVSRYQNGHRRWAYLYWLIEGENPLSLTRTSNNQVLVQANAIGGLDNRSGMTHRIDLSNGYQDMVANYFDADYIQSVTACPAITTFGDSSYIVGGSSKVGEFTMPYMARISSSGKIEWESVPQQSPVLVNTEIKHLFPGVEGTFYAFCESKPELSSPGMFRLYHLAP